MTRTLNLYLCGESQSSLRENLSKPHKNLWHTLCCGVSVLVIESQQKVRGELPENLDTQVSLAFPDGLLGFETLRAAGLEPISDAPPFSWLKFQGDSAQSFLVVAPVYVTASYRFELGSTDCRTLSLTRASDAGVLNIVTLRPDGALTVNLKGPIVYNKLTGEARQVVPINAAELPVNFPVAN
jgi:flagellar assembly factor FliW